jgi:hypothetical protein
MIKLKMTAANSSSQPQYWDGYWSSLHPDGPSYRVFAKQMTNPPAACGLSTRSAIDKSATTKSVQDDATRGETPK